MFFFPQNGALKLQWKYYKLNEISDWLKNNKESVLYNLGLNCISKSQKFSLDENYGWLFSFMNTANADKRQGS